MKAEFQLLKTDGFPKDIRENIEKLLSDLLGKGSISKIKERYEAIGSGNCFLEDFIPLSKDSDFAERLMPADVIGLDFPVWFGNNSGKRPIMIVCQDSGRDAGYHVGRKEVIVTTLFGVHNKKWREGPHGKPFAEFVSTLLDAGYPVYATDSIKFFATSYDERKGKYTPNSQLRKEYWRGYIDILKKEIEYIKPEAVIAMGGHAWDIIKHEDLNTKVKDTIEHLSYRYGNKKSSEENATQGNSTGQCESRGRILANEVLDKIKR